jgi:hypothetical protein
MKILNIESEGSSLHLFCLELKIPLRISHPSHDLNEISTRLQHSLCLSHISSQRKVQNAKFKVLTMVSRLQASPETNSLTMKIQARFL